MLAQFDSVDVAYTLLVPHRADTCLEMELLVDSVDVMQECRWLLNREPSERALLPETTLVKGSRLHAWQIPHFFDAFLQP